MIVTRQAHGHTYGIKTKVRTPYTSTYTQPLHNYIIAKLYHKWERLTWPFFRFLEKRVHIPNDLDYIPYTNRQDIRCYFLHEKNKIILNTIRGEEEASDY